MLTANGEAQTDVQQGETRTTSDLQPSQNVPSLRVPGNLELDLLLQEPVVANPLYLNFDERGRLWVVQYRQYPWPVGLKLISRDNVWRNVYDPPFPPPPPHAQGSPFRGSDRITIHEDTDGDGKFDKHKTFLEGLNLATAALRGRGGVFVTSAPYLLFYADRDDDDVPDSIQPRILLSGFGIEDTHSIANSLRWGPDGWIYGTQGSTVSASVVRHGDDGQVLSNEIPVHSMGQNVWRYHPERHIYEVFAEGGGNAFGIEFDAKGRVYSGHNGGDTRGFHYVQGGFSLKNFGKHGSLSNPYAFGHYDAMKHHSVERFTHTFEIYEANVLPDEYRGRLIGVSPNMHYTIQSRIFADGSTRQTRDVSPIVMPASGQRDNWFTPVDIQTGPDGALYIADWYSVNTNHYRSHEGQTNPGLGRVYRLRGRQTHAVSRVDLGKLSSRELIDRYLQSDNRWFRETAIRILGDRRDSDAIPRLHELAADMDNPHALEALWALNLSGGFHESFAREVLQHADPFVRAWTVRLLGDKESIESETAEQLRLLAQSETNVEVRLQLACSARRLPTSQALPVLSGLMVHDADAVDPLIPKMIWWSIESHADDRQNILAWLNESRFWQSPLAVSANLTENLMRRYAMRSKQIDLEMCADLLKLAPDESRKQRLLKGFTKAFEGRALPAMPSRLVEALSTVEGQFAIVLGVRKRDSQSIEIAIKTITDSESDEQIRVQYVRALGEIQADSPNCIAALVGLLNSANSAALTSVALAALQRFDQQDIADAIIDTYADLSPTAQETAVSVLASRVGWARKLMAAVEDKIISTERITQDNAARLLWHNDSIISNAVDVSLKISTPTDQQLNTRLGLIEDIIRQGNGRPLTGQQLFHQQANCGKCHQIFGRGGDIGPDLSSYNRSNLRLMLLAVINPNAEIREGYETVTVLTVDGQVVTGFVIDENDKVLVIRSADGQSHAIAKTLIEEQVPSKHSIMPANLLDGFSDDQIRDLFAFLTSTTPPK